MASGERTVESTAMAKTFQFCCPQGHSLEGDPAHAGMQTQCPICGGMFIIPSAFTPPPEQGSPAAVSQQESEPAKHLPGVNIASGIRGASRSCLQLREWTYVFDVFLLNVGSFIIVVLFRNLSLCILFSVGYCLFKDCFSGKSLAKAMIGLRVVDAGTGEPIGVGKSIARNWIFLIPLFPLVELIVANCREDKRRLGDLMAGTVVIRD